MNAIDLCEVLMRRFKVIKVEKILLSVNIHIYLTSIQLPNGP